MKQLNVGDKYKHFKGEEYAVVALARDSDTLEEIVVYKALYDSEKFGNNALWTRPKDDFLGTKIIDDVEVNRFDCLT